ncbi:MAG: saccharopine dehydrogenase NADP-binding domain-containing protein [Chloroflexi bacterium]|nr:saccharopine dehydrogenase NADP-binding domain-containing protein [Chloroflexota bacterium]
MANNRWMLYGAYGYTGELVADEALKRGHKPILAGRSAEKLIPLAERLGLEYRVVALDDPAALQKALSEVDLVFHAAGPFIHTASPMLDACVETGTHYVDITGEIAVFRKTFKCDEAARQKNIVLVSGVGFDIIPTDCLSSYVASQVPGAIELEIAFQAISQVSAGTTKSSLEGAGKGGWVRRDGQLTPYHLGKGAKQIRFSHGKQRWVMPIPWGDLETAYRATGIPNITTYMSYHPRMIRMVKMFSPVFPYLLALKPVRGLIRTYIEKRITGPDEQLRQSGKSYIWAKAADKNGDFKEAWLETMEAYQFTAVGGVRCVEKIFEQHPVGALTPSQAFGADFVLEIEGTRRLDKLDG